VGCRIYEKEKSEIIYAALKLKEYRLTSLPGGNVSIRKEIKYISHMIHL